MSEDKPVATGGLIRHDAPWSVDDSTPAFLSSGCVLPEPNARKVADTTKSSLISIDRAKVYAFLDDLGIDRSSLRSITMDYKHARLEYLVRGEHGGFVRDGDGVLTRVVDLPIQ